MKKVWRRTCQECGTEAISLQEPSAERLKQKSYTFQKCRKCKSESLDYGSGRFIAETPEEQRQLDEDY